MKFGLIRMPTSHGCCENYMRQCICPSPGPYHFSSYQPDFWLLAFASFCQKRAGAGLSQQVMVYKYSASLTLSGRITLRFVVDVSLPEFLCELNSSSQGCGLENHSRTLPSCFLPHSTFTYRYFLESPPLEITCTGILVLRFASGVTQL